MLPCFNASNVVKGGIRMQESSAKLKVCTQTVPSGGRTAGYHRRSAVSFYLVTDGYVHILLQGREITVRENEGAFVNSGVLHGMESVGADAAVLQVTFPPEYVTGAEDPRLTARYADPIVKAREPDCLLLRGSGWANDICDRLQLLPSVLSARRPGDELRAHILVSEIWLSLYEQTVPPPDRPCGVSLTEKKRMETLRQYIQDNYREKISLDDIASAAHISRGECCRMFKRLYSMTPFQYLVRYRLARSIYYLSETDRSIAQIAQSVGFCSSSYYTKCFRSEYQCTPLRYRQSQHWLPDLP